LNNQQKG